MDNSTSSSDGKRLEAAIQRLEAALGRRSGGDPDLQRKYDALTVQAQAALEGLDRLLASAEQA